MKRLTLVWSKFLSESRSVRSMNWLSGWKLMMSAGANPYVAVTSVVWAAMRAIWALVQVGPWPSGSNVMVTFGLVALYLSLMPAMAFLNASALEPEFQAMTLIVTGPPPPVVAGAAAAGAVVAAGAAAGAAGLASAGLDSAGFDSAGLAGALVAAGDGVD